MNPGWTSLSVGTYKSYIRNSRTGGKVLNLPLVSQGARPIDLIKRAPVGEDVANPLVYTQRFYTMASLRILLSDTAAEITALPGVTATAPVPLDGTAINAQYPTPADATHPPMATARGPLAVAMTTTAAVANGDTVIPANTVGILANINMPPVNLLVNGNAVTCTSRDAQHFYGCTNPLVVTANGLAVTSNPVGAGATVLTAAHAANKALGRLTVNSTAGFGPTALPYMWVNLPAAGAQPLFVTCLSADNNFRGSPRQLDRLTRPTK